MRHIIPFLEHVHIERTENKFYRFLPVNEIERREILEWSDHDIQRIKLTINLPETILMRNHGRMEEVPTCSRNYDHILIRLKKYILTVYKTIDDWFLVYINGQYGTMMKTSLSNYWYECDQFEGLIKLINDINNNKSSHD